MVSLYVARMCVFLSSVWHVWHVLYMVYVTCDRHHTHCTLTTYHTLTIYACTLTIATHILLDIPHSHTPYSPHTSLHTRTPPCITCTHPHSHYTHSSHAHHTHTHSPHIHCLTFTHIHTHSYPLTHIHHTHAPHTSRHTFTHTHTHHTPLATHPVWTTLTGANRHWKQISTPRLS